MRKLLVIVLLVGLGCAPQGYERDGSGYTLYRSRMMMPRASTLARPAPLTSPAQGLDKDDPPPDRSESLANSYTTLRP